MAVDEEGMLKKDDTRNPRFRMAAVLVIIHYAHRIPYIIMTKRNQELRAHSSEIAFPGGMFSKQDKSLKDTAIRETREEIGLDFEERSIIGRLHSVRTLTSNYCIIPFVTVQERISEPQILIDEVEKLIDAPLIDLLLTAKIDLDHRNSSHDMLYRFTYGNEIIWGATARILKQLYDCLL
jgi:8-oxo-dGTP pyrophosphatase MutT (NUDIX family)